MMVVEEKYNQVKLFFYLILNRMNNIGMALYFLPTIISSGTVNGGIKEKRPEIFYYSGLYGAV